MEPIQVCTLGEFSLRHSSNTIRESGSRSRRVWNLLAFLICHRGQSFSQQKLITLLWGSEPGAANPENTLRLLMHRTRATLDQLYEGAGRDCLLRRDSGYCWNPQIPVAADMDRFEQLCRSEDPGQLLEALSLYHGEFLGRLSCEDWAIPICAHFQNLFLETSQKAAGLLLGLQRYEEAVRICRRCIAAEPYFEPAYQTLMQTLAAMGDPKSAAQVYEDLSRLLFDDFGIRPSEETRAVYRTAVHTPKDRALPMEEVLEQLQEPQPQPGALLCDYDYFKVLCHAESRDLERSGTATHIALMSISGPPEKPLSRRSLNRIMDQFGQILRLNLRRGDTISRCSVSQYIIMLPRANYENSCMVCRRCVAAFSRSHPHVTAKIHFMVQPLTPTVSIP